MFDRRFHFGDGGSVEADGNLQTLLQGLYSTVSLRNKLVYSTQQLADEIKAIVSQMNQRDRESYLVQSLIVNFKFYERELIKENFQKHRAMGSDESPGNSESS
jgi:hypothetical protein